MKQLPFIVVLLSSNFLLTEVECFVLLFIFRSGSMVGTNFNIATAAANIIVESLQENDFFNIVHVSWLSSCLFL